MTNSTTQETASESDSSLDKYLDSFAILGEDGPFMDAIEGFQPRPVQQELAKTIDQTLKSKTSLVAEAGTGIGKTFAYLVPAVTSKKQDELLPSLSVVIANFPKSTPNKPSLLWRNDVSTFFHELGHALHALLGRTEMASFSGTHTKIDFVFY